MKNIYFRAFILIVIITSTLVFSSCTTAKYFIEQQPSGSSGFYLKGDVVGYLDGIDMTGFVRKDERYLLASGEGDTDNHLFEIRDNNILITKEILLPREYSVRVRVLSQNSSDTVQSSESGYFTFIVSGGNPWDPRLIGTWSSSTEGIAFNTTTNLTFGTDGVLIINQTSDWMSDTGQRYNWTSKDNIISIYFEGNFMGIITYTTYTAKYNISNNILTISDSSNGTVLFPAVYTKRE